MHNGPGYMHMSKMMSSPGQLNAQICFLHAKFMKNIRIIEHI